MAIVWTVFLSLFTAKERSFYLIWSFTVRVLISTALLILVECLHRLIDTFDWFSFPWEKLLRYCFRRFDYCLHLDYQAIALLVPFFAFLKLHAKKLSMNMYSTPSTWLSTLRIIFIAISGILIFYSNCLNNYISLSCSKNWASLFSFVNVPSKTNIEIHEGSNIASFSAVIIFLKTSSSSILPLNWRRLHNYDSNFDPLSFCAPRGDRGGSEEELSAFWPHHWYGHHNRAQIKYFYGIWICSNW